MRRREFAGAEQPNSNNKASVGVREWAMRAKLFFVTAVALFCSASVFSQSFTIGAFETGNKLLQACSDGHDVTQGYCKGYAVGVADAISAVNAMKANGMAIPSICIPQAEHITTEQVRDVVVQYLTAHPETRHETAAGHALLRLQAAFPCK